MIQGVFEALDNQKDGTLTLFHLNRVADKLQNWPLKYKGQYINWKDVLLKIHNNADGRINYHRFIYGIFDY